MFINVPNEWPSDLFHIHMSAATSQILMPAQVSQADLAQRHASLYKDPQAILDNGNHCSLVFHTKTFQFKNKSMQGKASSPSISTALASRSIQMGCCISARASSSPVREVQLVIAAPSQGTLS